VLAVRVIAVVSLVVLIAACGGDRSDSGAGGGATSGSGGSSARVVRLGVPKTTTCDSVTFTTVSVRYATRGAARAELRVNGRPYPLDDPSEGSVRVDVRCDPLPHDFVLFAFDEDGEYTSIKKLLEVKS
jgi:hypothetical protein